MDEPYVLKKKCTITVVFVIHVLITFEYMGLKHS